MAIINMHQAKTNLSDLVARAEAGEEIVIARRNKPAVKLVPVATEDMVRIRESRVRAFGLLSHLNESLKGVDWFEPLPDEELRAWEGAYSFDDRMPEDGSKY
jgi:prevent-host-death family protein